MTTYHAMKCPCSHRACKSWMVDPVAAVQGVGFTEAQARAVAALLNGLDAITASERAFVDSYTMIEILKIDDILRDAGWEESARLDPNRIIDGWSRSTADTTAKVVGEEKL